MTEYTGKDFSQQTVNLDGNRFERCNFSDCTIVYSGDGPVGLIDCSFIGNRFQFAGGARNGLEFLLAMLAPDSGHRTEALAFLKQYGLTDAIASHRDMN